MAFVINKPTVAFAQGEAFNFGSWVCVADDARSFQRHLTLTPEKKHASTKLSPSSVEDLVENFGEISLSGIVRGHELEYEYYSGSTSTWSNPRKLAPEPSCESDFPPQHLLFRLHNASVAYQALLPKLHRPNKEIEFDLCSDADFMSDYYSNPDEYKFDHRSDSSQEKPLFGPAHGLVITSTLEGRFVYWTNQKPFVLDDNSHLVACLVTLPSTRYSFGRWQRHRARFT
jgi:hypothetical protein